MFRMDVYDIPTLQKNYDRILLARVISQLSNPRKASLLSKENLKNGGTVILV